MFEITESGFYQNHKDTYNHLLINMTKQFWMDNSNDLLQLHQPGINLLRMLSEKLNNWFLE